MNTLTILEKFESVEIENASRISDEELSFCTEQQALYEKTLAHHRKVAEALEELQSEGELFMQEVGDLNSYHSGGYTYSRYHPYKIEFDKKECAKKHFGSIHTNFISIIMQYFNSKYGTDIEPPSYKALFEITEPELESTFRGFGGMSDEEKEEQRVQNHAHQTTYEEAMDEYLDYIINANLNYNDILDHIFVSLDGSTFAERAEQEIKDDSKSASSSRRGKSNYDIKNKKIALSILYPRKGWRDQYEVELHGTGYLAVLRALSYFDSNKRATSTYSRWHRFVCYSIKESEGIFETHEICGNKVQTFRYYKNGKFEIGFDSHLSAKKFAEEYLYCAAGDDEE